MYVVSRSLVSDHTTVERTSLLSDRHMCRMGQMGRLFLLSVLLNEGFGLVIDMLELLWGKKKGSLRELVRK